MTADTSPWALAACAGRSHLYEAADTGSRWATAECLRLCRSCPIQAFCLESTLAYEKANGGDFIHLIAGGMLPAQRAALLGKRYRNHYQTLKVTT